LNRRRRADSFYFYYCLASNAINDLASRLLCFCCSCRFGFVACFACLRRGRSSLSCWSRAAEGWACSDFGWGPRCDLLPGFAGGICSGAGRWTLFYSGRRGCRYQQPFPGCSGTSPRRPSCSSASTGRGGGRLHFPDHRPSCSSRHHSSACWRQRLTHTPPVYFGFEQSVWYSFLAMTFSGLSAGYVACAACFVCFECTAEPAAMRCLGLRVRLCWRLGSCCCQLGFDSTWEWSHSVPALASDCFRGLRSCPSPEQPWGCSCHRGCSV